MHGSYLKMIHLYLSSIVLVFIDVYSYIDTSYFLGNDELPLGNS